MRGKHPFWSLITVSLLAVFHVPAMPATENDGGSRSNFIIIFADDQGYGDVGCFGATDVRTPHIDRMAEEGIMLTNFYAQPVCGPSRAALMTGSYPIRVCEPGNRKHAHTILHPRERTVARLLNDAGYATGMIGKWHLAGGRGTHYKSGSMPNHHGFDYFHGTPLHNGFTPEVNHGSFKAQLMRNDQIIEDALTQEQMNELTRDYTREAVAYIHENKDRPFFLYLAHNMPHIPLGVSEKFRGTSERGIYGDVIQELDWSTGQVLETLEELGLDENTLVIYTSDNGPWIEPDRFPEKYSGSADPLRGAKMQTWEGGPRVPFLAWWPGVIPAGRRSDELVATMDIMPTFLNLAGVDVPDDLVIDGVDVMRLLTGETDESPRDTFFYYTFTHLQAVRQGDWKMVLPRPERPGWTSWNARMIEAVADKELYNLNADIAERRDVADEHPDVLERLSNLVEAAREELGDYNRIGAGARFFDETPRRGESLQWIDSIAEGSGYDVQDEGRWDSALAEWEPFSVRDDGKIADGFIFFGAFDGREKQNRRPWNADNLVSELPDYVTSVQPGSDFNSIAYGFPDYGKISNPVERNEELVRGGIVTAVSEETSAGDFNEILTFTLDVSETIRIGVLGGIEHSPDGRWSPTSLRISPVGHEAESLETKDPLFAVSQASWVFFDVTGPGPFAVSGSQRLHGDGVSIGGLTFARPGHSTEQRRDAASQP
ncbi:MAG: sulfatase family protein [Planctomycetota bacterium]